MELTREEWESRHQSFEAGWWGDCANTYGEETKQLAYAKLMGLDPGSWQAGNPWPVYDMSHRSVLDIGGGPVSMLLKCKRLGRAIVVDPCGYPAWTLTRYASHDVKFLRMPAEDYVPARPFDEAWIYNVLQHTMNPKAIVGMMRRSAKLIRVFEWVETEAYEGHPQVLHVPELQEWCGGDGRHVILDEHYEPLTDDGIRDPWRIEQEAWGGAFETGL